jgi:hypothetical protein
LLLILSDRPSSRICKDAFLLVLAYRITSAGWIDGGRLSNVACRVYELA